MENYMSNPAGALPEYAEKLETMYPEVYRKMAPHVEELADSLNDERLYSLTPEDVGRMADEAVARSAALADPPAGHNPNTVRDMARTMLVRNFYDRDRRRRIFPAFPFFFFPYGERWPYPHGRRF
jgi:hypothetical protein